MFRRSLYVTAIATMALGASILGGGEPAEGAKGGPKGGSASIVLNQSDPHLGDWVTFTYSSGTRDPRIQVACYQGGLHVVFAVDQAANTSFLLGGTSSEWKTSGGSAECVAYLYKRNIVDGTLARTSFTAGGAR